MGNRIETGVVQFGDDWPGVFIRGDDCFNFSMRLNELLANGNEILTNALGLHDVVLKAELTALAQLLGSSNVQAKVPRPIYLKPFEQCVIAQSNVAQNVTMSHHGESQEGSAVGSGHDPDDPLR